MRRMLTTIVIAVLFLTACGICIRHSLATLERAQRIKEQIRQVQEHLPTLGMKNGVEHRLERKK